MKGLCFIPHPSSILPHPSRKMLVVDDNVDAADSLAMLLRPVGQEVRVASDGPSALAQAEADPPAIAILDLGMPRMDGYELAEALRAPPEFRPNPGNTLAGRARLSGSSW